MKATVVGITALVAINLLPITAGATPSQVASVASWLHRQQIVTCFPAFISSGMFLFGSFPSQPKAMPVNVVPQNAAESAALSSNSILADDPVSMREHIIYQNTRIHDKFLAVWDDRSRIFAIRRDAYDTQETMLLCIPGGTPPLIVPSAEAVVVLGQGITIASTRHEIEGDFGYASLGARSARTIRACGMVAERFSAGVVAVTFVYQDGRVIAFDYRFVE